MSAPSPIPSSPCPSSPSTLPTNISRTPSPEPPPQRSIDIASLIHWATHGRRHYPTQDPNHNAERTSPPENPTEMTQPITLSWDIPLRKSQVELLRRGFQPRQMEDKWLVYCLDFEGGDERGIGGGGGGGGGVEGGEGEGEEDGIAEALEGRRDVDGEEGQGKGRDRGHSEDQEMARTLGKEESMKVFFVRSWTRKPIYEVSISLSASGSGCRETRTETLIEGEGEGEGEGERGERIEAYITSLRFETDSSIIRGHDDAGVVAKERVMEACRWILGVELGGEGEE
ncbi:hypothetical protein VTL71DRAFT_3300 [Oculimacula yallundae]|uniref:Uncharacterized protein n=1 Tax=Oculimacula yallundae TaxID=86028 RepID=A0ABR4C6U3_9HELO